MSFSQELKEFVASANAGSKLVTDQQKAKAEAQHYAALERYYDAKTPDNTPGAVPEKMDEGKSIWGAGGTGLGRVGAAVDTTAAPNSPATVVAHYDATKVPSFFGGLSQKAGLPDDFLPRTYWLESKFGQDMNNPNSSAGGHFQFTDGTAKQYGLTDKNNLEQSANATVNYALHNRDVLKKALGREPTGAELYLAHQQDGANAAKLLNNPNTPAISIVGRDAVINNGGNERMTAGDFANLWLRKYNALVPKAACGGMIHRYADGGAVDQQKPYYATDLMADVGDAMGKLGDAVRGGFQEIANKFGLNERPAVAQADPSYTKRIEAYARDPGADPRQVQEVKSSVDPNGELGDALATTYGLVKSYDYHLANGNTTAANKAAADILLYTRSKSRQLGALALHAMQEGDESTATKALAQAYNFIPNGHKMEINGDKATLIDQKTGQVIRQVEFTPATLVNAAMGCASGEAFLNDLSGVMLSEKEKVADIKAQSAVDVAGINAGAKTDSAKINTEGRKDVATIGADAKRDVANTGADADRDVANINKDSRIEGIDKQQAGANQRNAADNQRALDVANVNQGGANYRAGLASDTSLANNKNTNETNERIAGVKVEGQKDVAQTKAGAAVDVANISQSGQTQRNAATNESREKIQEGKNATSRANNVTTAQTKIKTTMDTLDAKASEGAANRASKEGIADANRKSAEGIAEDKIAGQNERNVNTNQARLQMNENNNKTSRQNKLDTIDANSANAAIKLDADKAKSEAVNAEQDRRVGRKAALTRQNSQLTAIDKMSDHAVLGVDEMTTPKVSAGQAQATRDIARGIVESSGSKVAGDQAAAYARQMTRFDKATGRPVVQVKLNPADHSVTMPDGTTLPLSDGAFALVSKIHGGAQ